MKSDHSDAQINLDDCDLKQREKKSEPLKFMGPPPIQEVQNIWYDGCTNGVDWDAVKEVVVDVPFEEKEKQELEKIRKCKEIFFTETSQKIDALLKTNRKRTMEKVSSFFFCCFLAFATLFAACFAVVSFFADTFLSTGAAVGVLIASCVIGGTPFACIYEDIKTYCDVKDMESAIHKDFTSRNYQIATATETFSKSLVQINVLQEKLALQKDAIEKLRIEVEQLITFPANKASSLIASRAAEFVDIEDQLYEQALRTKSHPALKAADEVKRIRSEKRDAVKKAKLFEHQVQLYENLFPWLSEYTDVTPQDIKRIVDTTEKIEDEYETVREWLSPDEYSRLSNVEKYQLALDRYTKRQNKSKWEIGIEYERYIGYLHECDGYLVDYSGALLRLEDMGRDLIARKGKTVRVIQCKRWSKEKTIHENHIFQLYGTCILLGREHPKDKIIPVFYTTTTLSETAKYCAKIVGVELHENVPFVNYPVIKCNVSQKGEKIYHLPFDQQYDRVKVSKSKDRRYVETVAEAEQLGFRRAHKWIPTQGD